MVRSMCNMSYEKMLVRLNIYLYRNVVNVLKYLKGLRMFDANKMFSINDLSRTISNGVELRCRQIQLDFTKFLFTNDVVRD